MNFKFMLFLFRYVQAGTVMNNYAHIFDLLTRLRQVNDYSLLITCHRFLPCDLFRFSFSRVIYGGLKNNM